MLKNKWKELLVITQIESLYQLYTTSFHYNKYQLRKGRGGVRGFAVFLSICSSTSFIFHWWFFFHSKHIKCHFHFAYLPPLCTCTSSHWLITVHIYTNKRIEIGEKVSLPCVPLLCVVQDIWYSYKHHSRNGGNQRVPKINQ